MANPENLTKSDSAICKKAANNGSELPGKSGSRQHEGLDSFASWTAKTITSKVTEVSKQLDQLFNPKDFVPTLQWDLLHDCNPKLTVKWADSIAPLSLQKAAAEKSQQHPCATDTQHAHYEPTAQEQHAFRHAMTAAVYSAKYGPWAASRLGAAAEWGEALLADANTIYAQTLHKDTRLLSQCAYWQYAFRSESNGDLLNDEAGAQISEKLKQHKELRSTKALVQSVAKAEVNGTLSTDFDKTWDSGKRAWDTQYFPPVPNKRNEPFPNF
jgi:hypothetical protein